MAFHLLPAQTHSCVVVVTSEHLGSSSLIRRCCWCGTVAASPGARCYAGAFVAVQSCANLPQWWEGRESACLRLQCFICGIETKTVWPVIASPAPRRTTKNSSRLPPGVRWAWGRAGGCGRGSVVWYEVTVWSNCKRERSPGVGTRDTFCNVRKRLRRWILYQAILALINTI